MISVNLFNNLLDFLGRGLSDQNNPPKRLKLTSSDATKENNYQNTANL